MTTSYWRLHGHYNPESTLSHSSPLTHSIHWTHTCSIEAYGNTTNTLLQFPMKWNWTQSSHLLLNVIIKSLGYRCNVITRSHTSLSCGLNPLLSSISSCRNSYPSQLESRCQVNSPFTGTIYIARNITNTITPGNRTPTPVINPLNPTPGSSISTWLCSTIHSLLTTCIPNPSADQWSSALL